MIRTDRLEVWLRERGARMRPLVVLLLARLRALAAVAIPRLRQSASVVGPRLQEGASTAATQLRQGASVVGPRLHEGASTAAAQLKPLWPMAEPRVRRVSGVLCRVPAALLPAAARATRVIQHELEAGRDTRVTPRVLRDSRGRRLRASAYN